MWRWETVHVSGMRWLAVACLSVGAIAHAGEAEGEIVVATHDVDRMSFERPDGFRDGRDIRVARYVLGQLGYSERDIEFLPVNVGDKFETVIGGKARLYIGAATLTREREALGDFTTPHLSVPYGAAVLVQNLGWLSQLGRALKRTIGWFVHPTFWVIIVSLLLYLRLKALIVTSIEKLETRSTVPFLRLFRQVAWWVECTFCNFNADSTDFVPKGYIARRVATTLTVLLVIVGVNYIQEGMGQVMRAFPERTSPECRLPGMHVGTKAGTTSVDFLHEMGASVAAYPTIEEALDALETGDIEAVVYDAVTLRAAIGTRKPPKHHHIAYVAEFGTQHYGAFFADDDPMVEEWNQIVLSIPAPLVAEWDRVFLGDAD